MFDFLFFSLVVVYPHLLVRLKPPTCFILVMDFSVFRGYDLPSHRSKWLSNYIRCILTPKFPEYGVEDKKKENDVFEQRPSK